MCNQITLYGAREGAVLAYYRGQPLIIVRQAYDHGHCHGAAVRASLPKGCYPLACMNPAEKKIYMAAEIRSLLSVLEQMRQDNASLKERLSMLLQRDISRSVLEQAEDYQQKFVERDLVIDLLRYDVATVLTGLYIKPAAVNRQRYEVLRRDITQYATECEHQKMAFGNLCATAS